MSKIQIPDFMSESAARTLCSILGVFLPTRQDVLAEAYSSGTLAFPKGHDEILEPVGVHVHEFVKWLAYLKLLSI